jgi:hypothetical protein
MRDKMMFVRKYCPKKLKGKCIKSEHLRRRRRSNYG